MQEVSKRLTYKGQYNKHESVMPQVRIEDIPQKRRKSLRKKRMCNISEDEFEEWLAVKLDDNKWVYSCDVYDDFLNPTKKELATEDSLRAYACYLRSEYRHIKEFARWEQQYLKPLIKELTCHAENDPQYDWHFLYKLERQKLICMEAYLSQSRVADSDGNYIGKKWLCLCITLLDYILGDKKITVEQIQQINLRNISGLVDKATIQSFLEKKHCHDEDNFCGKCFYGEKIYRRKMEKLYHAIRFEYTHDWWE